MVQKQGSHPHSSCTHPCTAPHGPVLRPFPPPTRTEPRDAAKGRSAPSPISEHFYWGVTHLPLAPCLSFEQPRGAPAFTAHTLVQFSSVGLGPPPPQELLEGRHRVMGCKTDLAVCSFCLHSLFWDSLCDLRASPLPDQRMSGIQCQEH